MADDEKALPQAQVTEVTVKVPEPVPLTAVREGKALRRFQDEQLLLVGKHGGLAIERRLALAARATGLILSMISTTKLSPQRAEAIIRSNIALGVQAGVSAAAKTASKK